MDATDLIIADAQRRGFTLALKCGPEGDKITVSPGKNVPTDIMEQLRQNKPHVLARLCGNRPPCPHCGGLDVAETVVPGGQVAKNCPGCGFFYGWKGNQ